MAFLFRKKLMKNSIAVKKIKISIMERGLAIAEDDDHRIKKVRRRMAYTFSW